MSKYTIVYKKPSGVFVDGKEATWKWCMTCECVSLWFPCCENSTCNCGACDKCTTLIDDVHNGKIPTPKKYDLDQIKCYLDEKELKEYQQYIVPLLGETQRIYEDFVELKSLRDMRLVTSNERKLAEFQRFGLDMDTVKGLDLREVDGTHLEVILYKARDAGPGMIVEDTSFEISGVNVGANIRWEMDEVKKNEGRRAVWRVLLGINDGVNVYVCEGVTEGIIVSPKGKEFGFDQYFLADGYDLTMGELEELGRKDECSARRKAVDAFQLGRCINKTELKTLSDWTGKYQH